MAMKVLIISGMPAIREKLKQLVEAQPDVETVLEAADTPNGCQAIVDFAPDVVVVDLNMPLKVCIEAIRGMIGIKPDVKIIALSMYSDRRYLDECVRAGACGYLLKDCAYEDLTEALRTVASDRPYVSRSVGAA